MRNIAIIGMIILLTAGVAFAEAYEMSNKVEEYTVDISIDKNPPSVGSNIMDLYITDKAGTPVKDAKIVVNYGTSNMAYKAALLRHGSGYHTELNLSMKGPWYVNITITSQEKTVSTKFTFNVN